MTDVFICQDREKAQFDRPVGHVDSVTVATRRGSNSPVAWTFMQLPFVSDVFEESEPSCHSQKLKGSKDAGLFSSREVWFLAAAGKSH